ncbi:hypothetical protein M2480_002709 [Parabacteroides sp. PFB2-12]|nr:hypothetical protein [Parabacteroides sp. PM6-13]MDH6391707.1 hypothetical protein [Parabacteroides sp. PFB2-12]
MWQAECFKFIYNPEFAEIVTFAPVNKLVYTWNYETSLFFTKPYAISKSAQVLSYPQKVLYEIIFYRQV